MKLNIHTGQVKDKCPHCGGGFRHTFESPFRMQSFVTGFQFWFQCRVCQNLWARFIPVDNESLKDERINNTKKAPAEFERTGA